MPRPLDTTTATPGGDDDDERPDQRGPAAPASPAEVAEGDRLYQTGERSRVLVRAGCEVPRRLLGAPYVPAVLLGGVFVPAAPGRRRR